MNPLILNRTPATTILPSNTVTGYVWDFDQRSIANVNITEVETGQQVQSNADGYFEITVSNMNNTLKFAHAGYDYDTIRAADFQSYIELGISSLPEAVVTNNSKPKNDNTLLYVGIAAVAFIAIAKTMKKQSKTVKV